MPHTTLKKITKDDYFMSLRMKELAYVRRGIICLRPKRMEARTEKYHDSEHHDYDNDGEEKDLKETYYPEWESLPKYNGKRPPVYWRKWTCKYCENYTICAQLQNKPKPVNWKCLDCE